MSDPQEQGGSSSPRPRARPGLQPPAGISPTAARWMGGLVAPLVWTLIGLFLALSLRDGWRLASPGWVASGGVCLGIALFLHARHFLRNSPRLQRVAHLGEMAGSALFTAAVLLWIFYGLRSLL